MMSTQGMLDGFDPPATRSAEIARVLVDVDVAHMDRPLDYVVPDALVDEAVVGSLVRVRLSGSRVDGWIVERTRREVSDSVGRLESVVSATPVVTPALYEASKRIALRFLATTSQVLSLAVPPRHARAEKEVLAAAPPAWPTVTRWEAGQGWDPYPAGAALLSRLRDGTSPRAIVTTLRPHVRACLSEAVGATVSSGRSVIVVTPTGEHATRVARELEEDLGVPAVVSGGEVSPEERYRVHVAASLGRLPIVVGTRSAVWVPCATTGLIVIVNDGDDRLRERRFPRCDALDVAVQRCAAEGAGLLVLSNARSVKAQALVRSGWAVSLDPTPQALREATPRVHLHGEAQADSEGAGGRMRIPQAALRLIRQGLREGPVLIQVASAGYWPTVVCRRCGHLARCPHCSGPLSMGADSAVTCGWCGREPTSWRCPQCAGTHVRGARVGASRTAEEIARTLPDASVLESSAAHRITRTLPARPTCPRAALGSLLVLVEALTSSNAGLALVNLLFEQGNNATLYGLRILSCRVHDSNVVCGDQANDIQNLEWTLWRTGANAPSPVDVLDVANAVCPQLLSGNQKRYQHGVQQVARLLLQDLDRNHANACRKSDDHVKVLLSGTRVTHNLADWVAPNLVSKVESQVLFGATSSCSKHAWNHG